MRKHPTPMIESTRILFGPMRSTRADGVNGAFSPRRWTKGKPRRLIVIASDAGGWEHVSASLDDRCPTWEEMCWIKAQFWREDETVIQFHPPKFAYVNDCQFTLHLWRQPAFDGMLPPRSMV